ncbi:hypothetical protein LTR95_002304 [Oleoguttula sp. CCFEE 5521]
MAAVAPGGLSPPPPPPPSGKRKPTSKAAQRPSKKQITCPGCDEDRSLEDFQEVFGERHKLCTHCLDAQAGTPQGADGDVEMADGEDASVEGASEGGNDSADPDSKKCYEAERKAASRKAANETRAKPLSADQEGKQCKGKCQQFLPLDLFPFFTKSWFLKGNDPRRDVCSKCYNEEREKMRRTAQSKPSALDPTAQQADVLSAVRPDGHPLAPVTDLSAQQESDSSNPDTDAVFQPGLQDNQPPSKKRRVGFGLRCACCKAILENQYTRHPNGNDLVCIICLRRLRCAEEYARLRSAPVDSGWEGENFHLPTSDIARGAVMQQDLASAEASFASDDARLRYRYGPNYWHLSNDELMKLRKEREHSDVAQHARNVPMLDLGRVPHP